FLGVEHDLPHRRWVLDSAHPARQPESVRAALRQVVCAVRKEMALLVAAGYEFADAVRCDEPECTRHARSLSVDCARRGTTAARTPETDAGRHPTQRYRARHRMLPHNRPQLF